MDVDAPQKQKSRNGVLKEIGHTALDICSAALVTALVFLALRATVMVIGVIPSESMTPTLSVGDFVFCLRTDYWFSDPVRGDIVFFNRDVTGAKTYVKRVIGVPGDIVQIKDGITYINGERLDETYLAETPSAADFGPYTVPKDEYFMLGDNRNGSLDSRYWFEHFVPRENIYAKVRTVLLPADHFGSVYD